MLPSFRLMIGSDLCVETRTNIICLGTRKTPTAYQEIMAQRYSRDQPQGFQNRVRNVAVIGVCLPCQNLNSYTIRV